MYGSSSCLFVLCFIGQGGCISVVCWLLDHKLENASKCFPFAPKSARAKSILHNAVDFSTIETHGQHIALHMMARKGRTSLLRSLRSNFFPCSCVIESSLGHPSFPATPSCFSG